MFNNVQGLSSKYKLILARYSTKIIPKSNVKYTNTINLPKTKFPSRLSPAKRADIENNINEKIFKYLYAYQTVNNSGDPTFVLHDGPPYANGDLHMGHAVNKILKDITIRQMVVNNRKVHYKPGWDCHGLPIELKASTKNLNANPVQIRQKSREFAQETIKKQMKEFKSWGIMADWNNTENIYTTFSPNFILNQLKMFQQFYKQNLVFRDYKPVYWSPSSRTALAEAELEYDQNFTSPSVILRIKLSKTPNNEIYTDDKDIYALVWTTTPWTLPSNQAICYNPAFEYSLIKLNGFEDKLYIIATNLLNQFEEMTGQKVEIVNKLAGVDLQDCTYIHPIDKVEILPFIAASHVTDTKGTGLVHTAPAHGPDDFLVSLKHKIPVKNYIDEAGQYTKQAPTFLHGKQVLNGGDNLVINYISNDIVFSGKISHSCPIDWRTKQPVIIRASEQWFMNTDALKTKANQAINDIKIYPRTNAEASKKALMTQVEKRPYWCISRQRAWGVPIPVFYEKDTDKILINDQIIDNICSLLVKNGNMDFWWSANVNELLTKEILDDLQISADNIEKRNDIFDIWFDSGITWMNALEGDKIADVYLEGFDQFTGWFQSSLLTSIAYRNCSPYKSLYVHGFTVDEKGHKMSKSLGNVISPKDIIQKHGTDTLRWWVASHGTQHSSIIVSDNLLQGSADSLSKIRLILRYLNGVIGEKTNLPFSNENFTFLDKYLLNSLLNFENDTQLLYNNYEYNRVTASILNFISNQISSVYVNLVKDRLYCGTATEHQTVQIVLNQCYQILCKTLYPLIPFMIEESWSYFEKEPFYKNHIKADEEWRNEEAESVLNNVLNLRRNLNQNIPDINSWLLNCHIFCNDNDLQILKKIHQTIDQPISASELCDLLQVSTIMLSPSNTDKTEIKFTTIENSLCLRCRRYLSLNETTCNRCDIVLKAKNAN